MNYTLRLALFFAMGILFFASCKTKLSDNTTNDWNSGKMVIATDENLKDITEQLVQIYQHENEQAEIILNYQPQEKIIHDFVNGKIKSMIISRNLSKAEKELANQNQTVETQETVFGYNAVALVCNRNFKDSTIQLEDMKNYLQPGSSVKLIFDNNQSGIPLLIMQTAGISSALMKNASVVSNEEEVLEYIHRDDHAIGFISFSRISDAYDPKVKELLSSLKVLDIRQKNNVFPISQESIYNFSYPLEQSFNMVLGNNPELVGRGFTNYLCRDKAAKIMLKAGLVPRFMPVRNIRVHEELKTN